MNRWTLRSQWRRGGQTKIMRSHLWRMNRPGVTSSSRDHTDRAQTFDHGRLRVPFDTQPCRVLRYLYCILMSMYFYCFTYKCIQGETEII